MVDTLLKGDINPNIKDEITGRKCTYGYIYIYLYEYMHIDRALYDSYKYIT
jgi:hypothetical protein